MRRVANIECKTSRELQLHLKQVLRWCAASSSPHVRQSGKNFLAAYSFKINNRCEFCTWKWTLGHCGFANNRFKSRSTSATLRGIYNVYHRTNKGNVNSELARSVRKTVRRRLIERWQPQRSRRLGQTSYSSIAGAMLLLLFFSKELYSNSLPSHKWYNTVGLSTSHLEASSRQPHIGRFSRSMHGVQLVWCVCDVCDGDRCVFDVWRVYLSTNEWRHVSNTRCILSWMQSCLGTTGRCNAVQRSGTC